VAFVESLGNQSLNMLLCFLEWNLGIRGKGHVGGLCFILPTYLQRDDIAVHCHTLHV
jgi:hypothetical protein